MKISNGGTKKLFGISKNICREAVIRLSARLRAPSRECGGNMSYDWEKEKLSDSQLSSHFQDIQYCSNLKQKTVTCQVCAKRLKVDSPVPDVSYCLCPTKRLPRREEGWEAYVERKDILVWRREHGSKRGLYEYKLYGKFDDVTVWEFLAVQLDLSQFRHSWDTSTAQCREVETQKYDVVNGPEEEHSQGTTAVSVST